MMMQQGGVFYAQAPPAAYAMGPPMPMQGMAAPGSMPFPGMNGMQAPATMPLPAAVPTNGLMAPPTNGVMTAPMTAPGPAQAPMFDDGSAAPFLHQYFQMVKSALAIKPLSNKTAIRELNGKLFPIIVEAFKRHDRDGNFVLDRNEAFLFFSHFVSERLGFHEIASGLMIQKGGDKEKAADRLENYKRNKAHMDQAAFKVFNSDDDGFLQMHEVVQALSLGTPEHQKLLQAFGFNSEVEEEDAHYYADHYA